MTRKNCFFVGGDENYVRVFLLSRGVEIIVFLSKITRKFGLGEN
jgi:hypothetical protein